MATDKLINHSQGESIITNLGTIATNLQNVTAISPAKFGMGYAVCDTAAGTAAKTANIANYVLTEGALVTVKFTNANTASNATLNLNNTGAKPILYKGSALTTDIISAGDICTFIYSTANSGSYNIINVDALSGAGAGTVKSVGAEGGIITDQTSGAAISTTGNVKLNLKSDTAFTATAPDPVEIENKIYPVALDASGHPAVSVPGTTYTEGDGIDITNNVIKNTGVTAVAPSDSSTGTNGTISVTTNGTTAEVAVKGLNNAAYKDVATSIPASGADDTKVATEKAVADSISDKAIGANSSTTNAIATFAGTDGKTLADSAVTIAKDATGVTDDDTKVPTSKAVKTYVDATATGISRYIGTITATSQLSTTAKKGDFYIVSTAWTGVHAGDEIIAEKDNPAQTIDGTNWTLLHNEADTNTTYEFAEGTTNGKFTVTPSDTGTAQSVTVHGLAASAYRDVDTTPTASSTKLVESGGVASALSGKQDTLTFDGTYSASTNKAATVSTVTNAINALDVSAVTVGATKTINKISQTDGKISVTTTDIQSASTSQKGLVQLNDTLVSTSTTLAATANAVKAVNDKAETNKSNILYVLGKTGRNHFNLDMSVVKNWNTGGTWNGNVYTQGGLTFTFNSDGTIDVSGTATERVNVVLDVYYPLNTEIGYRFHDLDGLVLSGCPTGGAWNKYSLSLQMTDSPWTSAASDTGSGATINNSALPANTAFVAFYLTIYASYPTSSFTFKPMFCTQEDWSIAHDYTPYRGVPNYDLTRLEAEDRASLAEVVDSGAKNILDEWNEVAKRYGATGNTIGRNGITYTYSNGSITISGTATEKENFFLLQDTMLLSNGNYVVSWRSKTINAIKTNIKYLGLSYAIESTDSVIELPKRTDSSSLWITIPNGTTVSGTIDIMVCTKAAFGVSPKFVPFGNDPSYQVSINHNMIYRGRNLGASLTDAQHTALSSGNFTDLYLGDYWTKTVTIPAGTYTGGDGEEVTVPAQTNITLKAVIADFDTFYAGYASTYAGINTHHAAVIVTGFSNVVWNKTNSTAGGYVASLIHKWLVGSALPQIETWFGSAKVLSHQKLLTNAITGDAASGWAWSSQKISLLSENQMYGSKVWGNSKAANGGYEPGEAFKHLNVFNHIDANLLFGDRVIWLRDIASAGRVADLFDYGYADSNAASTTWVAPAALILLS